MQVAERVEHLRFEGNTLSVTSSAGPVDHDAIDLIAVKAYIIEPFAASFGGEEGAAKVDQYLRSENNHLPYGICLSTSVIDTARALVYVRRGYHIRRFLFFSAIGRDATVWYQVALAIQRVLFEDLVFLLMCMKFNPDSFTAFNSSALIPERKLALMGIHANPEVFSFLDEDVQEDEEFKLEAVKANVLVFRYFSAVDLHDLLFMEKVRQVQPHIDRFLAGDLLEVPDARDPRADGIKLQILAEDQLVPVVAAPAEKVGPEKREAEEEDHVVPEVQVEQSKRRKIENDH